MGIISQPYKHPKTGVYWIRRSVPKDIKSTYGKTEVKRSLKTKVLSEARRLYPLEYDKITQAFDMCRREFECTRSLDNTSVTDKGSLSIPDINPLTARYYNSELSRTELTSPKIGNSLATVFQSYCDSVKRLGDGREKGVGNTLIDYTASVNRFIEFIGDKSVSEVTKADVRAYQSLLLALPSRIGKDIRALPLPEQVTYAETNNLSRLSAATVRKQLMALSSVFEFAVENELCKSNPVHGSTRRLTKSIEARTGAEKQYSADDISKIFSSPLFTDGYRPRSANYGEAVYWLPLLAYYTGARAEEICQLHVSDVRTLNNVTYIDVNADAPDKSVKNKSSARRIPVHSHLIELGFMDYVASLEGSERLFPALVRKGRGQYSPAVSKWLGNYFRNDVKVNPNVKPIHGFRHTFKTLARSVGIPKEVSDVITGHSSGSVAETYGEYPVELLHEAVNKIPRLAIHTGFTKSLITISLA